MNCINHLSVLEPAKVNIFKIFSGSCYMIKRVLTFISIVQESALVDFVSQNKLKTCKICLCQKFPYKNKKNLYIFLYVFEFLSCY